MPDKYALLNDTNEELTRTAAYLGGAELPDKLSVGGVVTWASQNGVVTYTGTTGELTITWDGANVQTKAQGRYVPLPTVSGDTWKCTLDLLSQPAPRGPTWRPPVRVAPTRSGSTARNVVN